jgi:hypothetical protein
VPRYFLHLRYRDGPDGLAIGEEGDEVREPRLRAHVEATARDLMRRTRLGAVRNWRDCTFEVQDEGGELVLALPCFNPTLLGSVDPALSRSGPLVESRTVGQLWSSLASRSKRRSGSGCWTRSSYMARNSVVMWR